MPRQKAGQLEFLAGSAAERCLDTRRKPGIRQRIERFGNAHLIGASDSTETRPR